MSIVSDFTVIVGDNSKIIGDADLHWEHSFPTNGAQGSALLMLMVSGLTWADPEQQQVVDVKINGQLVGHIYPYRWPTEELRLGAAKHWHTQVINIGAGVLKKSGNNTLELEAVPYPEATGTNAFDDFAVRDVVCFFKQQAEGLAVAS